MEGGSAPSLMGNMQHWPLLCNKILDYAAQWHGEQVSERACSDPILE